MQLPIKTKVYKIPMSVNIGKMICDYKKTKRNKTTRKPIRTIHKVVKKGRSATASPPHLIPMTTIQPVRQASPGLTFHPMWLKMNLRS